MVFDFMLSKMLNYFEFEVVNERCLDMMVVQAAPNGAQIFLLRLIYKQTTPMV
jgi:hypothetical protein